MTNIGKPYEGKPHVRFDEEGLGPAQPFTLAWKFEREGAKYGLGTVWSGLGSRIGQVGPRHGNRSG
ncbi:hypothetical protein P9H28_12370, partial [Paenibacillus barengoltzii]|uniref:hypothetical protein n=1 Tax=Paenibacillus barengoltzii TaxID=343517 RepID=UPI002DB6ECB4